MAMYITRLLGCLYHIDVNNVIYVIYCGGKIRVI